MEVILKVNLIVLEFCFEKENKKTVWYRKIARILKLDTRYQSQLHHFLAM